MYVIRKNDVLCVNVNIKMSMYEYKKMYSLSNMHDLFN